MQLLKEFLAFLFAKAGPEIEQLIGEFLTQRRGPQGVQLEHDLRDVLREFGAQVAYPKPPAPPEPTTPEPTTPEPAAPAPTPPASPTPPEPTTPAN